MRSFLVLLRKDLQREFRTREMLTSMGIYALLVIIVFGVALLQAGAGLDVMRMSGGLIWAMITFTCLLGLNRSFSYEKENDCLEGILLVPMDRGAVYLAKAASNLLFMLLVEVVAVGMFIFFFLSGSQFPETFPLIVAPLLVGTIGMAAIGTLLSTITANTRGKDVMLAVLFIPFVFPLLYACVTATTAVMVGGQLYLDAFMPSLALAVGYDIIMCSVSWVLYDFVISA